MLYVVSYDVADDRRRQRLANALLDFGPRLEESLFAAHLDDALAEKLFKLVEHSIHPAEDAAHIFILCAACDSRTKIFGRARTAQDSPYFVL